jgi:hypothetical protein
LALALDFFYLGSLILLNHFPWLKTSLDLQIFKLISCPDPLLSLQKSHSLEHKIGWSGFSRVAKFGHQQCAPPSSTQS